MKNRLKIAVFICLLVILGLVFKLSVKDFILDKKGIETIAIVTKFEFENISNSPRGNGFSSQMQYEFEVNGSKYVGNKFIEIKDLSFSSSNTIIGNKIQIVYLSKFPEINRVKYIKKK